MPYHTNMTQEELDLWVARLRDPNSLQHYGGGYERDIHLAHSCALEGRPMCCLVHLQMALEGSSHMYSYFSFASKKLGSWDDGERDSTGMFIGFNDYQELTLPQIADWIESNLLPVVKR